MAITLTVFRTQVDSLLVADDSELSQLRREMMIKAAVERYGQDRPDEITEDESGDGGRYYDLNTLLASWVDDFSRVLSIQYPASAISADEVPVYLDPVDWDDDYYDGSTRYLFLPNHSPAAAESMRIRYTAPYLWAASATTEVINKDSHGFSVDDYLYLDGATWIQTTDARTATHIVTVKADADNFTAALLQVTVPTGDFFAVCNLGAGLCCQAIATKYSRTSDSTITADSVNHNTKAVEFARRAREYIAMYEEHLGLGGGADGAETQVVQGAGEFVDWDTAPGLPQGRRWLAHDG
jgi:hypothetical protein